MRVVYGRLRHDLQAVIEWGVDQCLKLVIILTYQQAMIIANHLVGELAQLLIRYGILVCQVRVLNSVVHHRVLVYQ